MTKEHVRPDAIDLAAGLAPCDPAFALRDKRPQFVTGAAQCETSVLTPQDDLGLSPNLRAAVARRVALQSGNEALIAQYPMPSDAALQALASGQEPSDPQQVAIAQHADMIALAPREANDAHLKKLKEAGLTVPQIIALSELLAFVCFQMQIAHGFSLLR